MPGTAASVTRAVKLLLLLILKSMHFNLMNVFFPLVFNMGKKQQKRWNSDLFYDLLRWCEGRREKKLTSFLQSSTFIKQNM